MPESRPTMIPYRFFPRYCYSRCFVRQYVDLIYISAKNVIAAAHPLYKSKLLLGGVLSEVTDKMFAQRTAGEVRLRLAVR